MTFFIVSSLFYLIIRATIIQLRNLNINMGNILFKFVIFLLLTFSLYAKDLVNIYRYQGINVVEKELENSLKDLNYWKSYLENRNVDYGYYEYKKYILLAQKEQLEIALFEKIDDDYRLILRNSVIVGENQGDKLKEDNKKTPEGAYE